MNAAGRAYFLDLAAYLAEAMQPLLDHRILVSAMILLLAVTATNAAGLLYPPVLGMPVVQIYSLILLVRIAALFMVTIAVLRLATDSGRPAWLPDGGFWFYMLLFLLIGTLPALMAMKIGDPAFLLGWLFAGATDILLGIFAPWLVAVAVERPLAWQPARWIRRFGRWLPHRLFWMLLLILPLHALQSVLPPSRFAGARWFWLVILFFSALGALMQMIRLGLDVAAYRRVAQDSTPRLSTVQQPI